MAYFVAKDSSSALQASYFYPLDPGLLTPHRRPNPIKIRPTYVVPPTITLYTRSTYDLLRAGSDPTIFNRLKNLSRSPRHSERALPTPAVFQTNIRSPRSRPAHYRSVHFSELGREGVDRLSGVNGPSIRAGYFLSDHTRPSRKNRYALVGDWSAVWCECSFRI